MEAELSALSISRAAAVERVCRDLIADSLMAGREVRLRVNGSSMLPALWPGDELLIAPLSGAKPERGEILLYMREDRLFAHRVVTPSGERDEGYVITRGDGIIADDPPVSPSEFLGTVATVFRRGREVPVRKPSRAQRLTSSMVCRLDIVRRVLLKLRTMNGRSMAGTETGCRS